MMGMVKRYSWPIEWHKYRVYGMNVYMEPPLLGFSSSGIYSILVVYNFPAHNLIDWDYMDTVIVV